MGKLTVSIKNDAGKYDKSVIIFGRKNSLWFFIFNCVCRAGLISGHIYYMDNYHKTCHQLS